MRRRAALVGLALLASPAVARPAPAARVAVPIREVVLPDGVRRYVLTLTIGGAPVEAQLDAGSTGLRVLAAALPGPAAKGSAASYSYGSGIEFAGTRVDADVAIGALAGRVPVQRIDRVGCTKRVPDCPATRMSAADYRIGGDGQAGQGFTAIIGTGLHADPVGNPLVALGARRWIIELPHDGMPGRLVINPDAAEVARYHQFAALGDSNQVAGCLVRTDTGQRICGPAMLDTGASGLRVQGGKSAEMWPQGTPAAIALGDGAGALSFPVVIGRREQASGMFAYPLREGSSAVTLNLGLAPFFHWSVLFDADARRIGVADR